MIKGKEEYEGGKMSEKVLINGYEYTYIKGYRDNENLRDSLNKLTEKTYGFNFRNWYEEGYWGKEYIPYSLLDDDTSLIKCKKSSPFAQHTNLMSSSLL